MDVRSADYIRDEVAKRLGFCGKDDARLLEPGTPCSHDWFDLGTGKRKFPFDLTKVYGCGNCAIMLEPS